MFQHFLWSRNNNKPRLDSRHKGNPNCCGSEPKRQTYIEFDPKIESLNIYIEWARWLLEKIGA